jgi:protein SCO1/2
MPNPSKWLLYTCLGLFAAAGLSAALIARKSGPAGPGLATGVALEPRRALPDFSLTDHRGRPFAHANLLGHWSLLYFGYTNCPDLCPATLSILAAMEKRMRSAAAATRPQVVFVSLDAARDTPAQLASYVPYFDPEFLGVTAADQPSVEKVAAEMGVAVFIRRESDGSYGVDHSSAIFVVDPAGKLAAILTGPFTVDALTLDFRRIAAAAPS